MRQRTSIAAPIKPERPASLLPNLVLLAVALLAHAPLHYQLVRYANGLDPTFVHPDWLAHSAFPLVLHMASVPPVVWIIVIVAVFIRLCRNYRWRLER